MVENTAICVVYCETYLNQINIGIKYRTTAVYTLFSKNSSSQSVRTLIISRALIVERFTLR